MSLRELLDVSAPAKLNLFLHVVGRRADGYHLLESLFVLIDWCDTLHFERRDDDLLARHDLGEPLPENDLILRAARALQTHTGCRFGADISVLKRLPSGAGMGGGSSDAASTLLALNRLWGLGLTRAQLQPIALTLGADVPFFVGGHNALVSGIGETLRPLPVPRQRFAVIKPAAGVATQEIFASAELKRDSQTVILPGFVADDAMSRRLGDGFGRNDLQPVAELVCPDVVQALQWVQVQFGNSRMTGSGSAVFARIGMGDQPVATQSADQSLLGLPAGWVGRICRSLDSHPLVDWAN